MTQSPAAQPRFANPIIDADMPDPDAIALSSGGYALVTSSFDRIPGLPLWHSDDLLKWRAVGSAGGYRPDAPHDGGVWAPSIREHNGLLFIVWGDPDVGIFVVDAPELSGPWSEPRLVRAGAGLIDPCPFWDSEGRAHLVHGYARSRAGFANRLVRLDIDPLLTEATGEPQLVIDGDAVDGCTVLEGPKVYERDGTLCILAPAGGVEDGWQYAFRATSWNGPWQHRIVLAQGDSPVNGPHQGAWVRGVDGEEWFLHFQSKGHLGRVLHLQPLRWDADGWPAIGGAVDGGPTEPVLEWQAPGSTAPQPSPPADHDNNRLGDDFAAERLSPAWHTRGATAQQLVTSVGGGTLALSAHAEGALLRPLHGSARSIEVGVAPGAGAIATFVVEDAVSHELRLTHAADGSTHASLGENSELVASDALIEHPTASDALRIGIRLDGSRATFTVNGQPVFEPFDLTGRRWTGTEWGLAVRGEGAAEFGAVTVTTTEGAHR